MNGNAHNPSRREELDTKSNTQLQSILDNMERRHAAYLRNAQRSELFATLLKQRSGRIALDTVGAVRLDVRIERLFEAIRRGSDPWPIEEVIRVLDGIAGRLLAKRLMIGALAVLTFIPAVASLILLAKQNADMIEQNRVEEEAGFKAARVDLLDKLYNTFLQSGIDDKGQQTAVRLPMHHKRIRAEAFGTLIALEKQRWSDSERSALPATRLVDLRRCDLSGLAIGGRIGLLKDAEKGDFSRINLSDANLAGATIMQTNLDGSVFQDAKAEGLNIASPSAVEANFSGMYSPNAYIGFDGKSQTPLDLSRARFSRANLAGTKFDQVYFFQCAFEGADLSNATYELCVFGECDLTFAELGPATDWSNTVVHKTVVTDAQLETIALAPFCHPEAGPRPGTQLILSNSDEYSAWYAKESEPMREAAIEELKQLGYDESKLDEE